MSKRKKYRLNKKKFFDFVQTAILWVIGSAIFMSSFVMFWLSPEW